MCLGSLFGVYGFVKYKAQRYLVVGFASAKCCVFISFDSVKTAIQNALRKISSSMRFPMSSSALPS